MIDNREVQHHCDNKSLKGGKPILYSSYLLLVVALLMAFIPALGDHPVYGIPLLTVPFLVATSVIGAMHDKIRSHHFRRILAILAVMTLVFMALYLLGAFQFATTNTA